MLSTPKSNAKRNWKKKEKRKKRKGRENLKKREFRKTETLPSVCRSTKQKGARKTNEGTKKRDERTFFQKDDVFLLVAF